MRTWPVLDPLPFRDPNWKLKDPPKPKSWEKHDQDRDKYFIDKLGPRLWKLLPEKEARIMEEIERNLQQLFDRLCQYERSTGRGSLLILKRAGKPTIRAIDGVQAFAMHDMSEEDLLKGVDIEWKRLGTDEPY